ncbi:MAG TPA: aspartyl/asparaginyl beta-hydroxylase domain-containing protein [Flavobacteriales bacterium]|nr:aspartyl/asparaginyl beta-hydroxylase domain-containing protein [Flavobacteriales bacterium]
MSNVEKIWYSYKGKHYHGGLPAFFDSAQYSWTQLLENNYDIISNEVMNYLNGDKTELISYYNNKITSHKNAWQILTFKFWGVDMPKTQKSLPITNGLLNSIPGIISSSISILEPQTAIHPHFGDSNTFIRCHFGIDVPAGLPQCGIKVNGIDKSWNNGKLLMLCDAHEHSTWNKTNQRRVIILFDVLHEQYLPYKKSICINGLALIWIQQKKASSKFINKLPGFMQGILMRLKRVQYYVFGLSWK